MGKRKGGSPATSAAPLEVELRLAGDPKTLEAAFDSPPMAPDNDEADRLAELESSYFDTSTHRLRAKGLAFRVRKEGRQRVQTLKAGDRANGALLHRGEWETPLDGDRPKPDALPKKAAALLAEAAQDVDLKEVFRTRVRRRIRRLTVNGGGDHGGHAGEAESQIEAALDIGRIETAAGPIPVAEIELELLDGQPDSLYRLALDLQAKGALHLETRSKSSRAYDHLAATSPPWQKAEALALDPAASVDEAMAAIFRSCFGHWLANQAAALDGRDPEGVHQMRVGLRRLRSALSAFKHVIPEGQLAWLQADAQQAISRLGAARDWDVFRAEMLAPLLAARPDDRALRRLLQKADMRRRASYRAARKDLAGADHTRFALRFGQWLESRGWRDGRDPKAAKRGEKPIARFAARMLTRRHQSALAKGKCFADLSAQERHRLRIALKKLRYATEFFGSLFDQRDAKPYMGALKALQGDLGHLNDVAVAEGLLAELLAKPGKRDDSVELGRAVGLVIGWHARGAAKLEHELQQRWDGFKDRSPFWD